MLLKVRSATQISNSVSVKAPSFSVASPHIPRSEPGVGTTG